MKTLLLTILTLFSFLLASQSQGQSTANCLECRVAPVCEVGDKNFGFEYYGAANNPGGTTTLKFRVTNYSQFPLEYVAFELPGANLPAIAPVASYIKTFHYAVQNTYSDSLIRFTGLNTSTYRYDQADIFVYKVNSAVFHDGKNYKIKVLAKAGEKFAALTIDLENCGARLMTPLPVELISFKGKITEKGTNLTWITASEKNCDHFEVQHSGDGTRFEAIGKVAGNGTTSSQKTYEFIHQPVAAGKNYYRLKQVDLDGKYEYSPILVVQKETKNQAFTFTVFPNPVTSGVLNIALERDLAAHETLAVTISDLNGKTLLRHITNQGQEVKLDLLNQAFKPGLYLVQLQAGRQQSFQKIMIQ